MKFSTQAIHAGQTPDPSTGAVMTPVYLTSTYVQEELGKNKGYEYSRVSNPTRTALERNLAALEAGTEGIAFGSGLAAIDALLRLLKPRDHVGVRFDRSDAQRRRDLRPRLYSGSGLGQAASFSRLSRYHGASGPSTSSGSS